jgi:hypothetical protein
MFEMVPWLSGANSMKSDFVKSHKRVVLGPVSTLWASTYTEQSKVKSRSAPQLGHKPAPAPWQQKQHGQE